VLTGNVSRPALSGWIHVFVGGEAQPEAK